MGFDHMRQVGGDTLYCAKVQGKNYVVIYRVYGEISER